LPGRRTTAPRDEAKRAAWCSAPLTPAKTGSAFPSGLQPLAQRRATAQAQIAAVLDPVSTAEPVAAGRRGHTHAIRIAIGEPTPRRPSFTSTKIAEQLFVSRRTVDSHIRNILKELDARSRAEIAAWVTTQLGEHA
jgi:hypothetical protein